MCSTSFLRSSSFRNIVPYLGVESTQPPIPINIFLPYFFKAVTWP